MKRRGMIWKGGFTLVEIMIVVVLIGMLATIALPAFQRVRMHAQNTAAISDLRTFRAAFEQYNLERGDWPPDSMVSNWADPAVAADIFGNYIKQSQWQKKTPVGGNYDWDPGQFLNSVGISIFEPTVDTNQLALMDTLVDDGNLGAGLFRSRTNGVIWIMDPDT